MSAFLGVHNHFYSIIYLCGRSIIECIGACMCALLRLRAPLFPICIFTAVIIASHGLLRVIRSSKENLVPAEHRIELLNLLNLTCMVIYCPSCSLVLCLLRLRMWRGQFILISNQCSGVGTVLFLLARDYPCRYWVICRCESGCRCCVAHLCIFVVNGSSICADMSNTSTCGLILSISRCNGERFHNVTAATGCTVKRLSLIWRLPVLISKVKWHTLGALVTATSLDNLSLCGVESRWNHLFLPQLGLLDRYLRDDSGLYLRAL